MPCAISLLVRFSDRSSAGRHRFRWDEVNRKMVQVCYLWPEMPFGLDPMDELVIGGFEAGAFLYRYGPGHPFLDDD